MYQTQSLKKTIFLSQRITFDTKKYEDTLPPCLTMESTRKTFIKTGETFDKSIPPMKTKSMENIFDEINNSERQKYMDCNGGPKFDLDQNLVKWSIVGKPDQFMRIFNRKKVQIKTKKLDNSYDDEQQLQTKAILQQQQSQATEQRQARKTPKKNRGDYKLVPRQELLQKMTETRNRIQQNGLQQSESEMKLPLNMRNAVSREQRIMKSQDENIERWDVVNNQVASNCEREPHTTILMRSDQFRERAQKVQALESIKNDEEKFNDRLWYMRLRCYDHKDKEERQQFTLITSVKPKTTPYQSRLVNRFVKDREAERLYQQQAYILSDNQNNFGTKIIDNPYQQVETVISNQYNEEQKETVPLYSKSLGQMFDQKLVQRPKKKYVECHHFLSVQGHNQFDRELEYLKKDYQQQEYQYYEQPNDEPEDVKTNWNIKHLAKSGEHFYPKFI